jgi:formate dehydrogenase subunit delta
VSVRPEVRLGNDIARQFAHLPHDQATSAIANHLRMFWDPRMKEALRTAIAAGDSDVDPLLSDAARLLLAPPVDLGQASVVRSPNHTDLP